MFKKIQLPNGLRVILIPMKESQSVTALALFATGSKYETKDISGVSHFLEHMFFKGTKKRPDTLAISGELDKVGGKYNAFTSKEFTGYWAKTAPEHLELALDWISDILLNSKFEAEEIEKERRVIIEEINMYQDNPMIYVSELWENLLYGDQPAGWDITGTKETVNGITRENFLKYFDTHYRTQNAIVCLAGNIGEDADKKIAQYFAAMPAGEESTKLAAVEKQSKPEVLVYNKETDQTHLCLGVRAYDANHPDRHALMLLGTILGGMMSSRLFISVREKLGLAYYVRTCEENYTDTGFLVTQAGVANDRVKEAISAIMAEYRKIRDEQIGEGEIRKAKDFIRGNLRLGLETSDEIASWTGMQEILRKDILTPEQVFAKIEAVGSDDLERVAKDIFKPEKLNLALIGPFKEKKEFEKLLEI